MSGNTHTLRKWQSEFLRRFAASSDDFTLIACPAAGKTQAAFVAGRHQIDEAGCDRVLFIVPSDSLRSSVMQGAGEWGFKLKRNDHRNQLLIPRSYDGIVTTYHSIAANPIMYAEWIAKHKVFVVMDEVHHAGDKNEWGAAILTALGGASRRLLMSGTPWRKSGDAIPFATYDVTGNIDLRNGYQFSFRDAWKLDEKERAVRYVEFTWMDTNVNFVTSRGIDVSQTLSECEDDLVGQALTNAYIPSGDMVRAAVRDAHQHLQSIRTMERPDAAGLLLAPSVEYAKRYVDIVASVSGVRPAIVVSDDDGVDSSAEIARFRDGSDPWIIAVRQISEGVDIPRLIVEVFASDVKTPLFFHQAVGRIMRRRGEKVNDKWVWLDEPRHARVYVPKVGPFLTHAAEMEDMLASALKEKDEDAGRKPGDREDWDGSTLRIDFGNDGAYVAGMSFASGETVNAEELRAAEEMLGAARFMASDLLKRGVKFPTQRQSQASPGCEVVTEAYDPRKLERLKSQVLEYAKRVARSNVTEYVEFPLAIKRVNNEILRRFGDRAAFDEDTCLAAIDWLQGQM